MHRASARCIGVYPYLGRGKVKQLTLENIKLSHGAHLPEDEAFCLMEAVSYFAGEPLSDAPKCVCPVLATFGRRLNDWFTSADADSGRQVLVPFIPGLMNTAGDSHALWRVDHLIGWVACVAAPMVRDLGLEENADMLQQFDHTLMFRPDMAAEVSKCLRTAQKAAYKKLSNFKLSEGVGELKLIARTYDVLTHLLDAFNERKGHRPKHWRSGQHEIAMTNEILHAVRAVAVSDAAMMDAVVDLFCACIAGPPCP
jgi:hypothetical protein